MNIISIFNSIDGEVNHYHQGGFSTFIRLAGCNLQCDYCDTKWSWYENCQIQSMPLNEIMNTVTGIGCKKVTITGGEPLLQRDSLEVLVFALIREKFFISIETNGTIEIPIWPKGISWVVDYKSSSVGHPFQRKCRFDKLTNKDWVKFVVANRVEYDEILPVLRASTGWDASIAVSPMHGSLDPKDLVQWLQDDLLFHCVVNLQLHKYIWTAILPKEER